MNKILVIGSNGQIGHELLSALSPLGEVVGLSRREMDLTDAGSMRDAIRRSRPAIIVNAAAYTAVDKAETEPDLAMRINGSAPGLLGEEAARVGALLVHYSTDYVFDGTRDRPYREDDETNPLNWYGRSKLAGETAVRNSGAQHLIIRTSWVYAARGNNFVRTMLRLASERPELKIVDDQLGAPTSAKSIAKMTAQALHDTERAKAASGTYHFSAAGAVTWFGFAQAIFAEATRRYPGFRAPKLSPIPAADYPLPASRPANSRLDCARIAATLGIAPPRWETALRDCFDELHPAS